MSDLQVKAKPIKSKDLISRRPFRDGFDACMQGKGFYSKAYLTYEKAPPEKFQTNALWFYEYGYHFAVYLKTIKKQWIVLERNGKVNPKAINEFYAYTSWEANFKRNAQRDVAQTPYLSLS